MLYWAPYTRHSRRPAMPFRRAGLVAEYNEGVINVGSPHEIIQL